MIGSAFAKCPMRLALVVALLGASGACAQQGIPLIYDDGFGNTLPYRLFLPAGFNDPGAEFPLVMHLHGAGERGTNNTSQLAFIGGLIDETQSDHPSILVVPQAPPNSRWEDFSSNNLTEPGRLAMEILEQVQQTYSVDADQRYLTGLSMGGFGTWDLVGKNPGYFAAALPLSAGGQPFRADSYAQSRIWGHHGNADGVVPVEPMRATIQATREAGGDALYSEFTGGHGGWTDIYSDETGEIYDWMFDNVAPPLATFEYDPMDGSLTIDASKAPGGDIFSWRYAVNQLNTFNLPENVILNGAEVPTDEFFAFADGRFLIYSSTVGNGFTGTLKIPGVMPTGLDFLELMALNSQQFYFSSQTGTNRREFNVLIATEVPEPGAAALVVAAMALVATGSARRSANG